MAEFTNDLSEYTKPDLSEYGKTFHPMGMFYFVERTHLVEKPQEKEKKMKCRIAIGLMMAMVATVTLGAKIETIGNGNWTSTNIWDGAVAPGTNDSARINNNVVLDSDEGEILGIVIGRGGPATLTIQNGASLTTTGSNVGVEVAQRNASTLTMNGGQLTVAAGNLLVGGTNKGTDYQGIVNLLGGTMSVTDDIVFNTATDLLNIENNAQLILGGGVDRWTEINGFVLAGNIDWDNGGTGMAGVGDKTWDNGSGSYLHTEFDGVNTTVWVNETIPEPATLGLITIGSVGLLLGRRKFMM